MSEVETLAKNLLSRIVTNTTLREVSQELDTLALSKTFKTHAKNIVTDKTLTLEQQRTQLNYLLQSVESGVLHSFLTDIIENEIWIFNTKDVDYIEEFVRSFQIQASKAHQIQLITAIDLSETQVKRIVKSLVTSFDEHVIVSLSINRSIIGGVQVKLDNFAYDFTVRTKIQQFQREWLSSIDQTAKLTNRYDISSDSIKPSD